MDGFWQDEKVITKKNKGPIRLEVENSRIKPCAHFLSFLPTFVLLFNGCAIRNTYAIAIAIACLSFVLCFLYSCSNKFLVSQRLVRMTKTEEEEEEKKKNSKEEEKGRTHPPSIQFRVFTYDGVLCVCGSGCV